MSYLFPFVVNKGSHPSTCRCLQVVMATGPKNICLETFHPSFTEMKDLNSISRLLR